MSVFSHLSRRLLAVRISSSLLLPTATARSETRPLFASSRFSLNQTRSFFPSTSVSLPATATIRTTPKKTANKPAKKPTKKLVKKPAKKPIKAKAKPKKKKSPAKPKKPAPGEKIYIPREYRSPPSFGHTPYTLWYTQDFLPAFPRASTAEELLGRAKDAGATYKSLSDEVKKEISAKASVIREVAKKERQEWINNVPPTILRELNKRRANKGKPPLHKRHAEKRPLTPFFRYLNEFQKTQNMGDSGVTVVAKEAAQNWKMMSEAERESYKAAAKAAWDEYRARHVPESTTTAA